MAGGVATAGFSTSPVRSLRLEKSSPRSKSWSCENRSEADMRARASAASSLSSISTPRSPRMSSSPRSSRSLSNSSSSVLADRLCMPDVKEELGSRADNSSLRSDSTSSERMSSPPSRSSETISSSSGLSPFFFLLNRNMEISLAARRSARDRRRNLHVFAVHRNRMRQKRQPFVNHKRPYGMVSPSPRPR